jgi:pre-rRNA-processing protein IPI3
MRSLSNHRAAITHIALGHSASTTNVCVSASKDNTVIVWNYLAGDLLRTYLLPSTPLCLALDPCDRAVYVGFDDGSVQLIEFLHPDATQHPLYDSRLQTTPVQITLPPWVTPTDAGPALCIGLNYDGTHLLTGHASGKIAQWDTGRRTYAAEIADLNAPVTNLQMLCPFPQQRLTKAATIVKPKLGHGNYTFTAQFVGSTDHSSISSSRSSTLEQVLQSTGFPPDLLENAIGRFLAPTAPSSSGDDQLRKENEELWNVINEQRELQKKTWERYSKLKANNNA